MRRSHKPKRSTRDVRDAARPANLSLKSEEPVVVLRLDASPASAEARCVFERAGVPFRESWGTDPDIPSAEFGALRFVGLDDMSALAAGLSGFRSTLLSGLRKNFPRLPISAR